MPKSLTTPVLLATKTFELRDQISFTEFSGDYNPSHVVASAIDRPRGPSCTVHGTHSLLWCLDALARNKKISAAEIKVKFLKPIFLGEELKCHWVEDAQQLLISSNGTNSIKIKIEPGELIPNQEIQLTVRPRMIAPINNSFSECASMTPQPFEIFGNTSLAEIMFPDFCLLYGVATACEIAALSNIVGMLCPGLNSLSAGLQIRVRKANGDKIFSVKKSDPRFNLLNLSADGTAIHASIEAFYRPLE